ncbi:DUF6804 family protein [Agrococcus baldri]|uniref:Uncharacterized protein n=1 Tax=Agrococcus baldri TaxID=153730 RepID=A0AA87URL6_9MICO|nr:DUF6804 family protein [Agrococcus baldri]GEK79664.1 hypothetical protein ABA31_10150 [Agrococcus baldri]
MDDTRYGPNFQRNALAPGIIAALALVAAQLWLAGAWDEVLRYVIAILALIVAWFAIQARHWWWVPVFGAIAVIWNPVVPFEWSTPGQVAFWFWAHLVAAVLFVAAGFLIKTRAEE